MLDDVRPADGDLEDLADDRIGIVPGEGLAAASAVFGLMDDDLVGLESDAIVPPMPGLPASPSSRRLPRRRRPAVRRVARRRPRRVRRALTQPRLQVGDPGLERKDDRQEARPQFGRDGVPILGGYAVGPGHASKMLRPAFVGQVPARERLHAMTARTRTTPATTRPRPTNFADRESISNAACFSDYAKQLDVVLCGLSRGVSDRRLRSPGRRPPSVSSASYRS